ncbi:MAG: YdcF family protein [Chloroflexota bacterium]
MTRRSLLARGAIGCACLLVIATATIVVGYHTRRSWLPDLANALNVRAELQPADVIIILGGGDGDREDYGALLYRQGLAKNVIATGAPVGTDAETLDLVQRGVARPAIVLASGTQNTHEDALRSAQLMRQHRWHSALLVTDRYHIRRSLWTFQTALANTSIEILPAPVVGGWFDPSDWWRNESGFVAVNDEYLKLVYYVARGYISPSVIVRG